MAEEADVAQRLAQGRGPGFARGGRLVVVCAVLAGCIACDRGTKELALARLPEGRRISLLGDTVRLEHARNTGGFLGLGGALPEGARRVVFAFGAGGMSLAALYLALRRSATLRMAIGWTLVGAGGLGNLWDRLATGGWVTDFLNVGVWQLRTGIFNVADVAIMAGLALLLLSGAAPKR